MILNDTVSSRVGLSVVQQFAYDCLGRCLIWRDGQWMVSLQHLLRPVGRRGACSGFVRVAGMLHIMCSSCCSLLCSNLSAADRTAVAQGSDAQGQQLDRSSVSAFVVVCC
jgi:hypothetical protein